MRGFICGPRLYRFDGWFFEVNKSIGPWPLKKNGDPRVNAGRKFWAMWKRFDALSSKEQEKYRDGGGCVEF